MTDGTFVVNEIGKKWGRVEEAVCGALARFSVQDRDAACDALYNMACLNMRTDDPDFAACLGQFLDETNISSAARKALFREETYDSVIARLAVVTGEQSSIKGARRQRREAREGYAGEDVRWAEEIQDPFLFDDGERGGRLTA